MNSKVILIVVLVVAVCMGITGWYYFQNPKAITSQECSELNGIIINNALGEKDYKDSDVIAPVNDTLCQCLCIKES